MAQSTTLVVDPTTLVVSAFVEADSDHPGRNRLVINGTGGDDVIEVRRINGRVADDRLLVKAAGELLGVFTDVRGIVVNAGAGNDYVRVDDTIHANITVFGGDGNDNLKAGQQRAFLFGEAGNDVLVSTARSGLLVGAVGNDTLQGARGRDVLIGGDGQDVLSGGPHAAHGRQGADQLIAGPTPPRATFCWDGCPGSA